MIKTPVFSDGYEIFDKNGHSIISGDEMEANEAVKRINTHDELVSMLKDIALFDGGSECIKSKIARARELLEKCK